MPDTESLRDTIIQAYEKDAEAPSEAPATPEASEPLPSEPLTAAAVSDTEESPNPGRTRDEKGRFAPKPASPEVAAKATEQAGAAGVAPTQTLTPAAPAPATQALSELRAPQSWKPLAREEWAKLPRAVQEEATRLETETRRVLQDAAEHRKMAEAYRETVAPYEAFIRSQGVEPLQAIQGALQTFGVLFTGTPEQKAQVLGNLYRHSRIDVDLLAKAIDGQPTTGGPQNFDPNQLRQQIKQELLQDFTKQRQESDRQAFGREVERFLDGREYAKELSPYIAAVIQADLAEGVVPELNDDLYRRAAAIHPQVSKVFAKRDEAEAAKKSQQSAEAARAAGSSVRSQPTTPMNGASPKDLRAQIEASIGSLAGR